MVVKVKGPAVSSGNNSVSIGVASQATHAAATALGTGAVALHDSSTAIGEGARTNDTDQVMIGSGSVRSIWGGATITPTDDRELTQKHYVDQYADQNPYALFTTGGATPLSIQTNLGEASLTPIVDTSLDPAAGEYQLLDTDSTVFSLILPKDGNDLRVLKSSRLIRFANPSDEADNSYFQ